MLRSEFFREISQKIKLFVYIYYPGGVGDAREINDEKVRVMDLIEMEARPLDASLLGHAISGASVEF